MNSSGAIMLFIYCFVALAHFRFPYTAEAAKNPGRSERLKSRRRSRRSPCLAVMAAMCFMPGKQPEKL